MADEAGPGEGAGQTESEKTLAGFHKAMSKRTAERDAALQEAEALRAQIRELQAVTVPHAVATTGGVDSFTFRRDGTASATGHVRFASTATPDYDCVGIGVTRIHLGKITGSACVEK